MYIGPECRSLGSMGSAKVGAVTPGLNTASSQHSVEEISLRQLLRQLLRYLSSQYEYQTGCM